MTAPNLIVSISGLSKAGKTQLGLTFPEPIKVYSLDLEYKAVLAKFPNKAIEVVEYPMIVVDSLEATGLGFAKFWKQLHDDIYGVYSGGKFRTVMIDPASLLWEVIRYAYNEEQNKAVGASSKARYYGEPNARMHAIIARAKLAGVNLVLTHYLKDRWVNDTATGEFVLDGWRRTEGQVDIVLEIREDTRMVKNKEGKMEKKNVNITRIKGNHYDRDLNGMEFIDATYQDLLAVLGVG